MKVKTKRRERNIVSHHIVKWIRNHAKTNNDNPNLTYRKLKNGGNNGI